MADETETSNRQKRWYDDLKKRAAEGDPQAAEQLATSRSKKAARTRRWLRNLKERAETDPEAARKRADFLERANTRHRRIYNDLKERAKTDPEAARQWREFRELANARRRVHTRKKHGLPPLQADLDLITRRTSQAESR